MRKSITVSILCAISAILSADTALQPAVRWGFDSIDQNKVAPIVGKTAGRVLPKGDYTLVDGVSGKALHFGKKPGGVMLPKQPVDLTKPFTVTTVVKLDKAAAEPKNYRLFKDIWGNCGTRGPGARLTVFYGGLQFNSGDGKKSAGVITNQAAYKIPLEKFFHIAVTYDGTTVTIYAEGQKRISKAIKVTAGQRPICVGSCNGSVYGFMGAVDDLAIYDRALSAEEVAKLALDAAK